MWKVLCFFTFQYSQFVQREAFKNLNSLVRFMDHTRNFDFRRSFFPALNGLIPFKHSLKTQTCLNALFSGFFPMNLASYFSCLLSFVLNVALEMDLPIAIKPRRNIMQIILAFNNLNTLTGYRCINMSHLIFSLWLKHSWRHLLQYLESKWLKKIQLRDGNKLITADMHSASFVVDRVRSTWRSWYHINNALMYFNDGRCERYYWLEMRGGTVWRK